MEAIESIFFQTYKNFELIIINDASKDNSLEIIERFQKRFPKKIKLVQNKRNLNCGGDKCANKGILLTKGKYIARMDADDICHPKRLEKQIMFLEKHPEVFLVGANAYVINKKGSLIGEKLEPQSNDEIKKAYFTFHPLIHPSCTLRRVFKNKKFRYEIKYSANNDYYTFFKLLCMGYQFANLKEKLLYFRIHGANDTFINMKEKYLNTLKARLVMVFKYGYRPRVRDVLIAVVETIVVFLLPEKILTNIYLLAKGIRKPTLSFKNSLGFISLFGKVKLAFSNLLA